MRPTSLSQADVHENRQGLMLLQCLGRAAQGLAITTLELSALAIVVCSVMTSLCWLHKPSDVRTPIRLELHVSIEQIRREAGDHAMEPYKQTPLDFIEDLLPSWSLNVQLFMKMPVAPFERPLPRLGNDRLPDLKGYQEVFFVLPPCCMPRFISSAGISGSPPGQTSSSGGYAACFCSETRLHFGSSKRQLPGIG